MKRIILAALLSSNAMAETQLVCDAPTEREDGTAITESELSVYKLYSSTLGFLVESDKCEFIIPKSGLYAVTVSDTDSVESARSDSLRYETQPNPPKQPTGLRYIHIDVSVTVGGE